MKWGVALLDPALAPVLTSMVDAKILTEDVRGRPGRYDKEQTEGYGTIDTRLKKICNEANKNEDIEVYAIGFEAPQAGLDAMSGCASSIGYYYDVDSKGISKAFDSIASQIAVPPSINPIKMEAMPSNTAIPVTCVNQIPSMATNKPNIAAESSNSTTNIEGSFPRCTASM